MPVAPDEDCGLPDSGVAGAWLALRREAEEVPAIRFPFVTAHSQRCQGVQMREFAADKSQLLPLPPLSGPDRTVSANPRYGHILICRRLRLGWWGLRDGRGSRTGRLGAVVPSGVAGLGVAGCGCGAGSLDGSFVQPVCRLLCQDLRLRVTTILVARMVLPRHWSPAPEPTYSVREEFPLRGTRKGCRVLNFLSSSFKAACRQWPPYRSLPGSTDGGSGSGCRSDRLDNLRIARMGEAAGAGAPGNDVEISIVKVDLRLGEVIGTTFTNTTLTGSNSEIFAPLAKDNLLDRVELVCG